MLKNSKNKGFTLIELLVVIAIIGLLASIIIASLSTARQKARDARRVADLEAIQTGLELYFDSNRAYPTTLAALVTSNFLPTEPLDPLAVSSCSGTVRCHYKYAFDPATNPIYYHLGATLERNDSVALSSAKHCNSSGITCTAGVAYPGGTPFNGTSLAGCDTSEAAPSACYDLAN